MAITFGAEFQGLADLTKRFDGLPERFDRAEQNTVKRTSLEVLAEFRKNVNPPTLRHRSGHLSASTNASAPEKDSLGWAAAVGYRKGDVDGYARVQEGVDRDGNYVEGTTIRAKKRLLAIPIGDALTGAGVHRFKGPRDFEGVNALGGPGFWMRFNAHLFFVVPAGRGKGARLRFLYIGVPSVTVPGRKPLRTASEGKRERMRQIADEEVRIALRPFGV